MSLRYRTHIVESNAADRENLNTHLKKQVISKPLVTGRPALGELSNKEHSNPVNNVTKKPVVTKIVPLQVKKVTVKVKKEVAATNSETAKTTSNHTTQAQTTTLKRQESILSKRSIDVENNSKVERTASYSTKQLIGIIDADANDKSDPFLVSEYVQDIFEYLRSLEVKYKIRQHYMVNHRSSPHMRRVLINWMVDVHINFKFLFETLHLSIAILDRYLQQTTNVGRETLQLVGVAALLIAAKYEETYMPEIEDFVYVCDNTFSHSQVLKMELEILNKLKFNIGRPLSLHFLRRFNKIARVKPEHHHLAKYLLEMCLLEYELCHIDPSMQAAAACCLSISIINEVSDPSKVWTKTLVHYSSYKYSDIKRVVINLTYFLDKIEKSKYQAIRKKYASVNCGKISMHPKLQGPLVRKLLDEAQALRKT